MSEVIQGGITRKVLTGRSASDLQRYRDELKEGQEAPLFVETRHCSRDLSTQIAEWKALRQAHGTDGAERAARGNYESVDPDTGQHASGQMGTHVKYFDGRRWRKRLVRAGEVPTHFYVPAKARTVKESEAVHTIYAAGADLVNPENPEDCARFFLAVKTERDELYSGIQESMWLERNGESGLVHVHVASNATIYEDFTLDGVDYKAGQKMAGALTRVDDVRARSDTFLDAHSEFGFSQRLARVGTQGYDEAQVRDGQQLYWDQRRGNESNQQRVRRTIGEALLEESVVDRDSFITRLGELGVTVTEKGLRRGVPGKNHDYLYTVDGAKQGVSGKVLGIEYGYHAIGAQLDLKEASEEIEPLGLRQRTGDARPLPFEATPWSETTKRDYEKLMADIDALVRAELESQAAEVEQMGPAALGRIVVAELETKRSAWSTADLERVIDRRISPVRETGGDVDEIRAESLTAAQSHLVSILDGEVSSDRIRHWTTQRVVDEERIIGDSLQARGRQPGTDGTVVVDRGRFTLTDSQAAAARSLTGTHLLSVIEGPAGSGKTELLKAANERLVADGRRLVVVSPTKKGAIEAGKAIDAEGNSVHSMLYRAGAFMEPGSNRWVLPQRWKDQSEQLGMDRGTVLVVDEVGMLDKSTAAALHQYVDDTGVGTLALVGDSKQLAAIGRGGYLARAGELAGRHTVLADPQRFRSAEGEIDTEYAEATLRLRRRQNAAGFVSMLSSRGQTSICHDRHAVVTTVAQQLVEELGHGQDSLAISPTNELNQEINHAVFDRLVDKGDIDNRHIIAGRGGDRIAAGAKVATRKNSTELGVANRQSWTVTKIHEGGGIIVTDDAGQRRDLTSAYVREDVQLAWALTGHGAQGMTVDRAHTVLTERTDAAGLYVSLTRGRYSNTVHTVAGDEAELREKFAAATRRESTDTGLEDARLRAEQKQESTQVRTNLEHQCSEQKQPLAMTAAQGHVVNEPEFRSGVRRLRSTSPSMQSRLEALAEHEENWNGMLPEADAAPSPDHRDFVHGLKDIGVSGDMLRSVQDHLAPEYRRRLETYVDLRDMRREDFEEFNRFEREIRDDQQSPHVIGRKSAWDRHHHDRDYHKDRLQTIDNQIEAGDLRTDSPNIREVKTPRQRRIVEAKERLQQDRQAEVVLSHDQGMGL